MGGDGPAFLDQEGRTRSVLRGSGTLQGAVLLSAPHGGGDRSIAPFFARLHAPRRLVGAAVGALGRQQDTSGASADTRSTEHHPDPHRRPALRHTEGDARGAASAGGERDDPSEGHRHESLVLSFSSIDLHGSLLPHDRCVHEHRSERWLVGLPAFGIEHHRDGSSRSGVPNRADRQVRQRIRR
jgi:hypothetical protein